MPCVDISLSYIEFGEYTWLCCKKYSLQLPNSIIFPASEQTKRLVWFMLKKKYTKISTSDLYLKTIKMSMRNKQILCTGKMWWL